MKIYLALMSLFGSLSLMSIGGGNTVLPEMHLRAVNGHHWLTDSQFADIFSISQAAPGPSILIVALVGYAAGLHVTGVTGGLIGGIIALLASVTRKAFTNDAMLVRLDRELLAERNRVDRQRAEDRTR